jgi:LacI family transcriptional regulator
VSAPHTPQGQGVASGSKENARSGLLDILLPVVYDLYFSGILSGAAEAAYEQDMRLVLSPTLHEHARGLPPTASCAESDGASSARGVERRAVEALNDRYLRRDRPAAAARCEIPTVSVAHRSGANQACGICSEPGHRRIAAITGHPVGGDEERREGYHAALEAEASARSKLELEADFTVWAEAATAARSPEPPSAIFAFNDSIAIGALRAARERGLRVPDDLSILGFDDVKYAGIAAPPLTTVRQPLADMGRTAVNLLIRLLERQSFETMHIELPTRLVVRESTAPPRERP